ncbi:DegQ family serine endoprotease [Halomonas saccharevitans]|uniref:Probable periplasmic serine endoprotease DegP-like n=1 Tax=Halomonas saccharevitans TaxID=416872 RepID=A0A1I6X5N2_9GAMM|nr:DegQ family serine endoprotease [Halomonas saccharevitans]MDT8880478.1 DegQ family serine endoprotease [Halomonas saccharevitans]SFT33392.1 serine protease Do [Halomonas saccharevitans]
MKRMTRHLSLWMLLAAALLAWQSAMARDLPDFTELVEEAAPGVVNISTTRTVKGRGSSFHDFEGREIPEIFRHFFGDRFGEQFQMPPGHGQRPSEERQSLGSGFIIDEDGYVMTNAHVVDGADEIVVRLNDRRELQAELVGADAKTDVAVLKVDADNLPTLALGNSDGLRVGQWVAAIGSPFGFDHSVTAGIISAIDRTLPRDAYVPFIQTDVAINPGNSGGPLFNLDGEVIGVNSQILTRSGGYMGLSFAIPINVAMDVADQLRDDGQVSRGWLGVMIQPVSRDLAESFGMETAEGALIADLDPEGPAARGGLEAGDVILSVNGLEVDQSSTLPRLIGQVLPGSDVELTLLRDGERREETVTLGEWPDALREGPAAAQDEGPGRLGIAVQPLQEGAREEFGIEHGVRVAEVEPNGVAAAAGLRVGDVLVSIDHRAVEDPDQLASLVADLPEDRAVPVRLFRDGRSMFVAMRLSGD